MNEMSHSLPVGEKSLDVTPRVTTYGPVLHMFSIIKTTFSIAALQAQYETILPDKDLVKL